MGWMLLGVVTIVAGLWTVVLVLEHQDRLSRERVYVVR
jgi:hypothetical protein